jgi:minor extracellular serine protease Vpr
MKRSLTARLACGAVALSLGFATAAVAQDSLPASDDESGSLWFVELAGKPVADGNSAANVKAEKANFRAAASAAGIKYKERRAYDVLFNGLSVEVERGQRAKLASIPGVKAVWPVEVIDAPRLELGGGHAADLANALSMTGANIAHSSLGFTGTGIRVAVMDTGIDYDNADFGGDGVQRSNSSAFPNSRVVAGWDFVGDAFDGGATPLPDPVPDGFPDDCNGHGSHVAGIVGANGVLKGVAPDVVLGAYRVFGCNGSTTSDIMLEAMERALADDMDVLNMSIGARAQWPAYPTAAAAERLLKKGMVVVTSIGNNGPGGSVPDGPYAVGAPGVGHHVIGTASFDNTHLTQIAFTVSPDNRAFGYNTATAAPLPPSSGTLPMSKTGTPTTADDACPPAADIPNPTWTGGTWLPAGSQTGKAVLIRRGTCSFYSKALNAQRAGAAAVVLYNNAAGALNPTVARPATTIEEISIPVVAITQADGAVLDGRIAAGPTTLTWGTQTIVAPNPTGGLISAFSSIGMAADLTLKPDIGAPGGAIYSTVPIELGTHGNNSGTSMASPHVAGAVALLLEAKPDIRRDAVRTRLQNSADPKNWSGNPGLGFLDYAHRQGAGLVDIDDAILATVDVTPGKLAMGESEAGPQTRTLTITNNGSSAVTFDMSHAPALVTGPKNPANFPAVTTFNAPATATFSAASVTVPAGGTATVNVTITAPAAAGAVNLGQYGGYVVLTPQGGGQTYRVPYAGFIGDYQALRVLAPIGNSQLPWLTRLVNGSFVNQPNGATYTMVGGDIPIFIAHFDHHATRYEFQIVDAASGVPVHDVFNKFDEANFVGRNLSATTFFSFEWDGTRAHSNGSSELRKTVPDGSYRVILRVLKALGDANNPAHWETWTSPVVTIDRP